MPQDRVVLGLRPGVRKQWAARLLRSAWAWDRGAEREKGRASRSLGATRPRLFWTRLQNLAGKRGGRPTPGRGPQRRVTWAAPELKLSAGVVGPFRFYSHFAP